VYIKEIDGDFRDDCKLMLAYHLMLRCI